MRHSTRILGSAAIPLAAVLLSMRAPGQPTHLGPARLVVEATSAFEHGDTIALRFAGRLANNSADQTHLIWVGEVRSLASGDVVGTLTHDITCLGASSSSAFIPTPRALSRRRAPSPVARVRRTCRLATTAVRSRPSLSTTSG